LDKERVPRPWDIYIHFKDKPYQIITIASHSETGEQMVVYQALYGDFQTYVRPLSMFVSEVDKVKYPYATQKYRFELRTDFQKKTESICTKEEVQTTGNNISNSLSEVKDADYLTDFVKAQELQEIPDQIPGLNITASKGDVQDNHKEQLPTVNTEGEILPESVNSILMDFLDANSYTKKLTILTSNIKHINNRLINDMAVSLDCSIDEGPLDKRIQELIFCLNSMIRFEDRRLR
jgi:hypothetical protein